MDYKILDPNSIQWQKLLNSIAHDIYQLPEYLALEAKRTNSIPQAFLASDNGKIFFVSFLIRSCQNIIDLEPGIFDVISPYGYPGIILNQAAQKDSKFCISALEKFRYYLNEQNICSGFFRLHPILNENLQHIFAPNTFLNNGITVSVDLARSQEKIWQDTKYNHRQKIKRCLNENSLTAKIIKFWQGIDIFCQLYNETMVRVGAKDSYYSFNYEYFQQMNSVMGDRLYLCLVKSALGEPASAVLYTGCGNIVQAAFAGNSNKFIQQSPGILAIDTIRWWAKDRGYKYFHLGGGVDGCRDGLYQFKAGFSRLRHYFYTLRLIIDQEKYDYLINSTAKSNNIAVAKLKDSTFFPAYRNPLILNIKH